MTEHGFDTPYGGSAPENYERYFVPAIGAPLAAALVDVAGPQPGEQVLDVACGTGIVTRLLAERVGPTGRVAGLDGNPGMLAVARSVEPPDAPISWHEGSAEKLPFSDDTFDIVTCQMGLQFFPDKIAALHEKRRVLTPVGRVVLNLPGPTPPMFENLADALKRHVGPQAAGFVHVVFSLHDADEIRALMTEASFRDVRVDATTATFPIPADFMWQYIYSTPLVGVVGQMDDEKREAFADDVIGNGHAAGGDGTASLAVRVTTVTARA